MILGRLLRAARARLHGRGEESGFALVYVLLVTTVIVVGVATSLTITTTNFAAARTDQNTKGAEAAAQAGVEDFIGYLMSQQPCRSTTRVCSQALGRTSASAVRQTTLAPGQTFSWTSNSAVTADGYVRLHSTGTDAGVSRTLVADISLAPSILSFGYYTNFESQSGDYILDQNPARNIYLSDGTTYGKVNAYNTSNRKISVPGATTMKWKGAPATSSTSPTYAGICNQHWYKDSLGPGRASYGDSSIWSETGTIAAKDSTGHTGTFTMPRSASCDVVFTSGMTFNGGIYTRDALLISDGTVNGPGPIFNQPAYTLWGSSAYNTPAVTAGSPWRQDSQVSGKITGPNSPAVASYDLQLDQNVVQSALPNDACVYYGPTRVKLNGDGTATITSPLTTAAVIQSAKPGSDTACYPASYATGILNFTLNYQSIGNGAIYVKDLGTTPTAGWSKTGQKSTSTPGSGDTVFNMTTSGGTPDTGSFQATDSCASQNYSATTANAPCAWTSVRNITDGSVGWSTYSNQSTNKCNTTYQVTDERLFECEYSYQTSTGSAPNKTYATLRTTMQNNSNFGGTSCVGQSDVTGCLVGLMQTELNGANSGKRAANTTGAGATPGDHQYVVTGVQVKTTTGTTVTGGTPPAAPMNGDSLFSTATTTPKETPSYTTYTLSVGRQTYDCYTSTGTYKAAVNYVCPSGSTAAWGNGSSGGKGSSNGQFATTVTGTTWAISTQGTSNSYFPNMNDVTQYNMASSSTLAPGDMYVQGMNQGQLSLIASDDIVVTGDVKDSTTNTNSDAIDIVAGRNVRNYHPVSCTSYVSSTDITNTSPGWCPNDITSLYTNQFLESNGTLACAHPGAQYVDLVPSGSSCSSGGDSGGQPCPSAQSGRRIDAAIFALSGSFLTDNYNRGCALGTLTINGGLYQSHRGANGVQWEYQSSDATRAHSGYSLNYNYVDLEHAQLPYEPPATNGANTRPWNVVSISAGP